VIVKPVERGEGWNDTFGLRKAVRADTMAELGSLWPQLRAVGVELMAQQFIAGGEDRIESYHCYVDRGGAIAGEFTGRKLRTYPVHYGHTSALEITDAPDVQALGRAVIEKIALTGVAKLDFKRDAQGRLHLLEINPRFNLWHHAGAVAGVNIPALVYADLAGIPRPATARARAGVRWCRAWNDLPAALARGVPLSAWLNWTLRCEAKSALAWDDPLPFLGSSVYRLIGRHVWRAPKGIWRGRSRA
jgi:predicted ATP-grasp superfamily ATP-dependent carboligase